jgi:hypothetical protein
MAAIRAERDYVVHEDFMKVSSLCVYTLETGGWAFTISLHIYVSGGEEAR